MKRAEQICFALAGTAFALFVGNIALGAARAGVILGDVGEMLTLLAACLFFVIAVLVRERRAQRAGPNRADGRVRPANE